MQVKDLCRCSFVCNSAEDSVRIFKNLTADNKNFKVFQFKNDFNNPEKKITDYRDMKIILKTSIPELPCDFLIEVQIIQATYME